MKVFLSLSALFLFIILTTVQGGLTSCTKDNTIYDTVTIIKKDTVIIKDTVIVEDTLTKAQMLAQSTWQVDELWRNVSGTNSHYLRGGENTTGIDYSKLRLTFNEDGTGTYVDEVGITHTTTWQFTGSDMFNATLTIGPPSAQTFSWSLVEINETSFTSTSVIGSNFLLTVRYVPVP